MNCLNHNTKHAVFNTLCTLTLGLSAGTTAGLAAADGRVDGFEMSAVADRHHGQLVMAGHYQTVINRNRTWARVISENTDPDRVFPFSLANNLCVAYTISGKQHEAMPFCDAAVTAAQTRAELTTTSMDKDQTNWAIALSNRGVLKVLTGDRPGARADFQQAMTLDGSIGTVSGNLHLLDSDMGELAQQTATD